MNGIDLDVQDDANKETALMLAIGHSAALDVFKCLLKHGASVRKQDSVTALLFHHHLTTPNGHSGRTKHLYLCLLILRMKHCRSCHFWCFSWTRNVKSLLAVCKQQLFFAIARFHWKWRHKLLCFLWILLYILFKIVVILLFFTFLSLSHGLKSKS